MNWKPPEFTEAEVRDLLSRKPGQPKIVKYPKRSAWDDLWANDMLSHTNENVSEYIIDAKCLNKYREELKQIRAKE